MNIFAPLKVFNLFYSPPKSLKNESCSYQHIVFEQNQSEEITNNLVHIDKYYVEHIIHFLHLIDEDEIIQQFLKYDRCYVYADKYLLSMVFVYFIRSRLPFSSYNRLNFFAALYLAHDMEEDDEDLKSCLPRWALPRSFKHGAESLLVQVRCNLWAAMDFRACVSLQCCLQVMDSMKDCTLWTRERRQVHGGAIRSYVLQPQCDLCLIPRIRCYNTDLESSSSEDSSDDHEEWFLPSKKFKFAEE
ncbi:hypothetical protein J6590_078681 [Homalodisca vitripennis]|nr:hypothetical protein J6590_078681 [Homalodisca vitripennis]